MTIALPPPEDRSFADVWSALGGELKPSLDVVVSAPIDTGQRFEAGPPVRARRACRWGASDELAAARGHGRPAGPATSRAGSEGRRGRAPRLKRQSPRGGVRERRLTITAPAGQAARCVEERVRALVAHRRAGDPDPDDPFRGLYLSDETVDRLLAPDGRAIRPSPPTRAGPRRTARTRRRRGDRSCGCAGSPAQRG